MDDDILRVQIEKMFPNIPEEVRNDWLLPSAKRNGWPPKGSYWHSVLLDAYIPFWQSTAWTLEEKEVTKIVFDVKTLNVLNQMRAAFDKESDNIFSRGSHPQRHMSSMKYLFENGVFPKPISILEVSGGVHMIADGHHRLTAWLTAQKLITILKKMKEAGMPADDFYITLKDKWQIESMAPLLETQTMWVARPN